MFWSSAQQPWGWMAFFFPPSFSPPSPFSQLSIQATASPWLWLLEDVWAAEALVRLLRLSFTCFEKCYRISNTHLKPSFQISPLNIMKKNILMFFIRYSWHNSFSWDCWKEICRPWSNIYILFPYIPIMKIPDQGKGADYQQQLWRLYVPAPKRTEI